MISTRDLSLLPDIDRLRRLLQSMAMLDALLCPEWEFRYYSYNSRWGEGEHLASMRDGEGDHFFALFNAHGCFLKGFAHESAMSPFRTVPEQVWPGVLEGVPSEFADCLREPAFNLDETTFCIWRRYGSSWQHGPVDFPPEDDPDGSADLLSVLDGNPETYQKWARWYFDKPTLTTEMVRHVYEHRPLTNELVAALTPGFHLSDLREEMEEIDYP